MDSYNRRKQTVSKQTTVKRAVFYYQSFKEGTIHAYRETKDTAI